MSEQEGEFEEAVHAYARPLFGIAYTILRDGSAAEDAVQATMESAWRGWGKLRNQERSFAWLRQICVRQCLRQRATVSRHRAADIDDWADSAVAGDPAHDPNTVGRDLDLDRAYRRLSRQQRAVIALHYHYGFALDECARLMKCRPGTARSHLARGLDALRKELSDE